jgi:hypothetical protein
VSIPSRPARPTVRRLPGILWALALVLGASTVSAEVGEFRGLAITDPITRLLLEDPTLVHEPSPVQFVGTLRIAEWLMDRPQAAAALARRLHPPLERYVVTSTPDGQFEVADQDALRGRFRLVGVGPDRRLYRCVGQFGSPDRFLHVSGELALFLGYRELPRLADAPQMEILPALYIRLENLFVRGVATLLGPMLRGVIDRRVASLAAATRTLSRRIVQEPRALYTEMARWPEIRPADLEAYRRAFLSGGAAP